MQLQERLLRGVPLTQELSLSVQSRLLLWQPWWKKPFCGSPGLSQRNAQAICGLWLREETASVFFIGLGLTKAEVS